MLASHAFMSLLPLLRVPLLLFLQLVVEILSEQMVRLPVRFEDVEVPLWAESADEYKTSVVQFRSQVRSISPIARLLSACIIVTKLRHN